ncbi:sideroflexin-1 [Planococcus citri]|uniref:sideroflexin-1 n=1 Tax=Planococcus citri TaxID=170843 RepID=UPI0031F91FAB
MSDMDLDRRVNIDAPRWDQNTYIGRLKYFFNVTNPLYILKTDEDLNKAKELVDKYKSGQPLHGVTLNDVYHAKNVVDSAFHPDTGEKMILFGRMSAQVPMNMIITGCMITFYKSTPAVVFWQWFNQSFNALVNYTNRSGSSEISTEQITKSYVLATSGAVSTAIALNKLAKRAPSVVSRLVPFAAVAAANCINIPLMRYKELEQGLSVVDENNNLLGHSKTAATYGISAVVLSRICMCAPGMILTPFIVEWIERKGVIRRYPWLPAPLQLLLCGVFLTFATPMCCALFPQTYPIAIHKLETEIQENGKKLNPVPLIAYYNKGL